MALLMLGLGGALVGALALWERVGPGAERGGLWAGLAGPGPDREQHRPPANVAEGLDSLVSEVFGEGSDPASAAGGAPPAGPVRPDLGPESIGPGPADPPLDPSQASPEADAARLPANPLLPEVRVDPDIPVGAGIPVGAPSREDPTASLLPPPPEAPDTATGPAEPDFGPYDVPPRVRNRDRIQQALTREYPARLRDAGAGGTVDVAFHINDEGGVEGFQVIVSSGNLTLDAAALRVAEVFEFDPALFEGAPVASWVRIGITFESR